MSSEIAASAVIYIQSRQQSAAY